MELMAPKFIDRPDSVQTSLYGYDRHKAVQVNSLRGQPIVVVRANSIPSSQQNTMAPGQLPPAPFPFRQPMSSHAQQKNFNHAVPGLPFMKPDSSMSSHFPGASTQRFSKPGEMPRILHSNAPTPPVAQRENLHGFNRPESTKTTSWFGVVPSDDVLFDRPPLGKFGEMHLDDWSLPFPPPLLTNRGTNFQNITTALALRHDQSPQQPIHQTDGEEHVQRLFQKLQLNSTNYEKCEANGSVPARCRSLFFPRGVSPAKHASIHSFMSTVPSSSTMSSPHNVFSSSSASSAFSYSSQVNKEKEQTANMNAAEMFMLDTPPSGASSTTTSPSEPLDASDDGLLSSIHQMQDTMKNIERALQPLVNCDESCTISLTKEECKSFNDSPIVLETMSQRQEDDDVDEMNDTLKFHKCGGRIMCEVLRGGVCADDAVEIKEALRWYDDLLLWRHEILTRKRFGPPRCHPPPLTVTMIGASKAQRVNPFDRIREVHPFQMEMMDQMRIRNEVKRTQKLVPHALPMPPPHIFIEHAKCMEPHLFIEYCYQLTATAYIDSGLNPPNRRPPIPPTIEPFIDNDPHDDMGSSASSELSSDGEYSDEDETLKEERMKHKMARHARRQRRLRQILRRRGLGDEILGEVEEC